ncbi:unnamed protein product [Lactuca virosa]|uniref:Uncharacterized protein n=1 Tax=Lactuca virosa TaxID=75947 RepID=A0AAU9LGJ4_9ASTR|nr:unnamed protein product [Lactuca virosa]
MPSIDGYTHVSGSSAPLSPVHQRAPPPPVESPRGFGITVLVIQWVITLDTLRQMVEMHEMFSGKIFEWYHELGQHTFGDSEPPKMFDRTANLSNNQIINYRCDPFKKWLVSNPGQVTSKLHVTEPGKPSFT